MRINSGLRIVPVLFISILLTLFAAGTAVAQSAGSINGTVKDGSGAAVPGAELSLTNVATGQTRQAVASGEGYFNFTELGSGLPAAHFRGRVQGTGSGLVGAHGRPAAYGKTRSSDRRAE